MNVGSVIAQLRHERRWTQETLAGMLFVSKDLVSKWETGVRRPDYSAIERIAEVFGVEPDVIIEKDVYVFEELSECIPDGIQMPESEFTKVLNEFLSKAGIDEAEIFVRRYYLTESIAAISEKKGMRENHIRSGLSKSRKKLIKMIRRQNEGR